MFIFQIILILIDLCLLLLLLTRCTLWYLLGLPSWLLRAFKCLSSVFHELRRLTSSLQHCRSIVTIRVIIKLLLLEMRIRIGDDYIIVATGQSRHQISLVSAHLLLLIHKGTLLQFKWHLRQLLLLLDERTGLRLIDLFLQSRLGLRSAIRKQRFFNLLLRMLLLFLF